MNTVIIEDETAAVQNLKAILSETAPDIEVIRVFDSIKSAVRYFRESDMPDLVFADIQLADGESFEIFKEVDVTCPIIFTTAYDSYAMEAFKVNSIDYLLKPIEPAQVQKALTKLRQFTSVDIDAYSRQIKQFINKENTYRKTFLVNVADKFIPVPVSRIAYFYTTGNRTLLTTMDDTEYAIDKTLETVMSYLDPSLFFRANRQFIVSHKAVAEVAIWFGNRLSVVLSLPVPEKIIISKARVSLFKQWLRENS